MTSSIFCSQHTTGYVGQLSYRCKNNIEEKEANYLTVGLALWRTVCLHLYHSKTCSLRGLVWFFLVSIRTILWHVLKCGEKPATLETAQLIIHKTRANCSEVKKALWACFHWHIITTKSIVKKI